MRLRPLIIGTLAASLLASLFWRLAASYDTVPALAFDTNLTIWLRAYMPGWLTTLFSYVTVLGGTPFVAVSVAAIGLAYWRSGRVTEAAYAIAVPLGGGLLVTVFKELLGRERPPVAESLIAAPPSMSLPSGHAMGSLVLAWIVCYLAIRTAVVPLSRPRLSGIIAAGVSVVLLVGASRVYLGVHWPSDVVASWLLGGAWIALLTGVYEAGRLRQRAESEG